jgi:glycosyltransferase involved in cell wall biosynthesis
VDVTQAETPSPSNVAQSKRFAMRILLLTQVVPYPLDSGPKIKTFHVLRYLAQRHELRLLSFARSDDEEAHAQTLRGVCAGVTTVRLRRSAISDAGYLTRSLLTGRPFLVERDDRRAMHEAARTLVDQHAVEAVHADQLTMAQFAVDLPLPLRVLDQHNAVWTIVRRAARRQGWRPQRVLAEIEWRKLRSYEGQICRSFDTVTVVSEADRVALEQSAQASLPVATIPITIDPQDLPFEERSPAARHILSVATMFYPPNVEGVHWFSREVFPLVRRMLPETLLRIVGSRPPQRIAQLAHPTSGIVVTGYVADLKPVLRQSGVLIVPVHSGSGMRVKILEAFARGIPVVSTRVGVEGIDASSGEHLLVADEPRDFARAVVELLRDRATASRLAHAARQFVEANYDWRRALSGLDEVYPCTSSSSFPICPL